MVIRIMDENLLTLEYRQVIKLWHNALGNIPDELRIRLSNIITALNTINPSNLRSYPTRYRCIEYVDGVQHLAPISTTADGALRLRDAFLVSLD